MIVEEAMRYVRKGLFIFALVYMASSMATPADQLKRFLNQYTTYSADFTQLTLTDDNQTQQSSGQVFIQRPGRFRWITLSPTREEIIVNGHTVWHYDVALQEASKSMISTANQPDNPLFLLTGRLVDQLNAYDISVVQLQGKIWYKLIPKKPVDSFQKLYFYFERGRLSQLIMYHSEQKSLFRFSHVQLNQMIPAHYFDFNPPQGVDVDASAF